MIVPLLVGCRRIGAFFAVCFVVLSRNRQLFCENVFSVAVFRCLCVTASSPFSMGEAASNETKRKCGKHVKSPGEQNSDEIIANCPQAFGTRFMCAPLLGHGHPIFLVINLETGAGGFVTIFSAKRLFSEECLGEMILRSKFNCKLLNLSSPPPLFGS
jgi:hypothetical protein